MSRGRQRDAVTLMIIPGSARSPITLRIPPWIFSLLVLTLLGAVLVAVLLLGDHFRTVHRLSELERQRALSLARQEEMRHTILAQQGEVKTLHAEVSTFRADLDRVRSLGQQIAALMGWDEPPEPTVTPTPAPEGRLPQPATTGLGGLEPVADAGYEEMALAADASGEVRHLYVGLPEQIAYLEELRRGLINRLRRIEPTELNGSKDVERQLRIMTAAPKGLPVWGEFTSGFGWRVFRGRQEFHTGLDIGVWYGTEVQATDRGVVEYAGWMSGYGWTVIIDHRNGFKTIYGHNSWYLVDSGDRVEKGDVIALSGSSGYSSGPHVHYEVMLRGIPIDPLTYAFIE